MGRRWGGRWVEGGDGRWVAGVGGRWVAGVGGRWIESGEEVGVGDG